MRGERRRRAYQGLHVAVQSVAMVSAELGVGALQGRVTRGLGLLDTVASLSASLSCQSLHRPAQRTHCDAPCASGCAETSSLTLQSNSQ